MWKTYRVLLLLVLGWQVVADTYQGDRCTNCCVLESNAAAIGDANDTFQSSEPRTVTADAVLDVPDICCGRQFWSEATPISAVATKTFDHAGVVAAESESGG